MKWDEEKINRTAAAFSEMGYQQIASNSKISQVSSQ